MKLLLFFFCFSAYSQVSYLPHSEALGKKGSEFSFMFDYFSTKQHVDSFGDRVNLEEGESYQHLTANFKGAYGLTSGLEINVGVGGRFVQTTDNYNSEALSFQNLGGTKASLGFKYAFPREDGVQYSYEGVISQSLKDNKIYDPTTEPEEIGIEDQGKAYQLGFNMSILTNSKNYFSGHFLYRNPGEELSSEFFSQMEYIFFWQKYAFGFGVENNYSFKQDPYVNDPENKTQYYFGETYLYNSINRSWTAPYLKFNVAVSRNWRIEFGYKEVISGSSTDLGSVLLFNFIKRSDVQGKFANKNSKFKEYRVEGIVTKVSKTRKTVAIDKGLSDGLQNRMQVDFYYSNFLGKNELIASGVIVKTQASKSLVKITKRYSKKRVEEGVIAQIGEI